MEEALRAIEEAENIDASNPDVWYNVSFFAFCLLCFILGIEYIF